MLIIIIFYLKELEIQCKYQGISTFSTVQPQAHMTTTNTVPVVQPNPAATQQQQINTQQLINQNIENNPRSNGNGEIIYQQLAIPVKQEPGIMIDYNGQTILTFSPHNQQQQIQPQQQQLQQQHQQQQQQQHHLLQPIHHTNFQHSYYQPFNDSGLSLQDLNNFDDHILSPIKQNDPLLSNCTIYDENLIDTLN